MTIYCPRCGKEPRTIFMTIKNEKFYFCNQDGCKKGLFWGNDRDARKESDHEKPHHKKTQKKKNIPDKIKDDRGLLFR